jgi:hypothetical protein
MREGILNEPTREAAERLLDIFGQQMGLGFTHLLFVAVAEDGTFRTANVSREGGLTRDAVRLIARHIGEWADTFEN